MKVLKVGEQYLRYCGLFKPNQAKFGNRMINYIVNVLFVFGLNTFWMAAFFYILQGRGTMADQINALLHCCIGIYGLGSYAGILVNTGNINRLHNELQILIDNGKYTILSTEFPF